MKRRPRRIEAHPSGMSRRDFMRFSALLGVGAVGVSQFGLAACSSDSGGSASGGSGNITIANWVDYIDKSLIPASGKAAGAKVKYLDNINSNEEWFAKADPKLRRDESIGSDGVVLTDWMVSRILQLDYLQKLDQAVLTNKGNLQPDLQHPSFDKNRAYSLPWQTGITGIAYNEKMTGKPITTIDEFFSKDIPGGVTVLDEKRDTIGLIMLSMGISTDPVDYKKTEPAFDKLEQVSKDNILRGVNGNEYVNDLSQGNLAACFAWSGDVAQITRDNPDVKFAIPDSGGMLWADNFVIPKTSDEAEAASKWINFFYDPVNAAKVTVAVEYISPVVGVAEQLQKMGGDAAKLAENPLVVPTADMRKNLHIFGVLDDKEEEKFDARWAQALGQ